jgi:hypothetical protein
MQQSNYRTNVNKGLLYLGLFITGVLIIYVSSLFQTVLPPSEGEYYFSTFLRNNFTPLAKGLFVIIGLIAGYFFKPNPWLVGLSLHFIFPITSFIESIIYQGSHNLLPIEFAFQLWFAIPTILAAYIGRFISGQIAKRKRKNETQELNKEIISTGQ